MIQVSIMIALMAALGLGDGAPGGADSGRTSLAVIPSASAGGGEGGWPAFARTAAGESALRTDAPAAQHTTLNHVAPR